jgi:hypothetical protein
MHIAVYVEVNGEETQRTVYTSIYDALYAHWQVIVDALVNRSEKDITLRFVRTGSKV